MVTQEGAPRRSASERFLEKGRIVALSAFKESVSGVSARYRHHRQESLSRLAEEFERSDAVAIDSIRDELRHFGSTVSRGVRNEVEVLRNVGQAELPRGLLNGVLAGIRIGLLKIFVDEAQAASRSAAGHTNEENW